MREECLTVSIFPVEVYINEIIAIGDTVSDLEECIASLVGGMDGDEVTSSTKIKMLWNESDIKEFLEHFRAHKSSLTIHISALNRYALPDSKQGLCSPVQ